MVVLIDGCMDEGVDEWVYGRLYVWFDRWMEGCDDGWVGGEIDGWMYAWVAGWMDGWMCR